MDPFNLRAAERAADERRKDQIQDMQEAALRGRDVWANVNANLIRGRGPNVRRAVTEMKKKLIDDQKNKVYVRHGIEFGSRASIDGRIETKAALDVFATALLESLEEERQFMILETFGDSNMWKERNEKEYGKRQFPSDVSSGVNVIVLTAVRRDRREISGCIHIGKILTDECGGRPVLPELLAAVIQHPNCVFIGESITRHIERLENSFFGQVNDLRYLQLTDLVLRCVRYRRGRIHSFEIDPFDSNRLVHDFHQMSTRNDSFFFDVYAHYADWNDVKNPLHEEMVVHALVKAWAALTTVRRGLKFLDEHSLFAACMVTIWPRKVYDDRIDGRREFEYQVDVKDRTRWWEERDWPPKVSDGTPGCKYGGGDPQLIRELQAREKAREERRGKRLCIPSWPPVEEEEEEDEEAVGATAMEVSGSTAAGASGVAAMEASGGAATEADGAAAAAATEAVGTATVEAVGTATAEVVEAAPAELSEARAHARQVAASLTALSSAPEIADLLQGRIGHRAEFATELIPLLPRVPGVVRKVLNVMARWMPGQKNRIVEDLCAAGHFEKRPVVGLMGTISAMRIQSLPPRLFLLFDGDNANGLATLIETMLERDVRAVVSFLCTYLDFTLEERIIQLESFPYYRPGRMCDYVRVDEGIVKLIGIICRTSGVEPTDTYFRTTRDDFVKEMLKQGKEARVSVANAAKMALRAAGENFEDRNTMLVSMAAWPAAAREMRKTTGTWREVPFRDIVHPNLKEPAECRRVMHAKQTSQGVLMIKDEASFRDARAKLTGGAIHVYFIPDRDPRKITTNPSLLVMKSATLKFPRVCAMFINEVEPQLVKTVLEHVGRVPIATRGVAVMKKLMAKHQLASAGVINLQAATVKHFGGRTEVTVAYKVWELHWCPIASAEWYTSPLTESQAHHLAYFMDLNTAAIRKIGLQNLPVKRLD